MGTVNIPGTSQARAQTGNVALDRTRATAADFGGDAFGQVADMASGFAQKLQNQADVAWNNENKNNLYSYMNEQAEQFKQNSKGKNVLKDGQQLEENFQKYIQNNRANVPERYQALYDSQAQATLSDFNRVISDHQNREIERYKVNEFQAAQTNAISFIGSNYQDEKLVNEKVRSMTANQIAYDQANGQSDEVIKANALNTTTAARSSVVDQYLSGEKLTQAKSYLEKYQEDFDPAVRSRYLSKIDAALKTRRAAAQKEYSTGVSNYISYLADGNEPIAGRYTKDQIVNVYGQEKGEKIYQQVADYEDFATKFNQVRDASPQELNELLSSQKPGSPEDYPREARQYKFLLSAVDARNKRIAQDPAAYSMSNDLVKASFQRAAENGDYESYASATIAEQERIGVPSALTRILDKTTAKNFVMQYKQGGESAADLVNNLRQQYGEYFPRVMRDLYKEDLPPNVGVVAVLGNSPAATYLSEADKIGFKTLKANVGNDDYKAIQTDVSGYIGNEYSDSINGLANQSVIKRQIQTSAETLALYYLDNGLADSTSDAAEKAYKEIISDRYEFRTSGSLLGFGGNTYRVPVEINGYSPNTDKVDNALDKLLDVIPKMSLMSPADPQIESDELREQLYKRRLQPRWLTRGDDAGVELVDQNNQPVLLVDGQKIFYTWRDLEEMDLDEVEKIWGLVE